MARRPGTPRLLRELNDRAALELLITEGPLTRAQIGARTGLSKVTASQLLARLEERGLVEMVGERTGGRGPSAALYGVVPASAYVAGLEVGPREVVAAVADITGAVGGRTTVPFAEADDPVEVIRKAVAGACGEAKAARLRTLVIGTPGLVDPRTGDVRFAFDLGSWHEGASARLGRDLDTRVVIENDVNLVAVAEHAHGAARDAGDFALLWIDRGIGLAIMLGERLHRGVSGGAGELGYLPVPGVPLPGPVTASRAHGAPTLAGGFGALVGADALLELARAHGHTGLPLEEAVDRAAAAPAAPGASAFLDDLASRLALGVAAVTTVLDPGLIVLSGSLGAAGGTALAVRTEQAVARLCPTRPRLIPGALTTDPVLQGALHTALTLAREEVFSTTTD
ncbi:ROK family transcriptional regulator [Actinocorallia libanotica]|uniref:ROK family transcriptional regulator n=1 Tax=Actinocorallia libanotica TaxID=46162 RepID=A0ABP4CHT0_9ACTN